MDKKKKKGLWHLSKVEEHIVNKYIKKKPSHWYRRRYKLKPQWKSTTEASVWQKIKRPDNTKYLQGCEVMGTFFYCLCKSKLLESKKNTGRVQ